MEPNFRIGIDTGGTFTDLVAFDEESGKTFLIKSPSTPSEPSEGVIEAFRRLMRKNRGRVVLFVHASTIGTNIFLGQMGLRLPKGALITTSGFRDVLEIGRQRRAELYNPFFERPKRLIEPELRFTIDERMDFRGHPIKEVNEAEVKLLAQRIKDEGVETIAISFLHAYANFEHEKRVEEILKKELPTAVITASHEVDPEYREYERTSTTVVNSLLIPVVSGYLENLIKMLEELDVIAPFYVMQSNGGLTTVETASKLPVATIESGPATGVIASAYWSRLLGFKNVLSFDMGGTTAKAGTVIMGVPEMVSEYEVGGKTHSGSIVKGSGYPVRYPFIDLAEVGAGGGTIAWVDQGILRVGPLSAGADPGPACYGRGGENPTVSDANLILGRLNPASLSGGAIEVLPELAEKSLREKVAEPLDISPIQAANGIIKIVNSHMMRALSLVSIERGYDPRSFTLLAFGGAGPMHAPFLAEGLGIESTVIPPSPGVFSALGLILADFRHDFVRSVMKQGSEIAHAWLEKTFNEMEEEAVETLRKEGFTLDRIVLERKLAIRYVGQSYELVVPMQKSFEAAVDSFHLRHREIYGYAAKDEPIEVVNTHLVALGIARKPEFRKMPLKLESIPPEALITKRDVFFEETGWKETPVYSRNALLAGNRIEGPAIIEQYDSTTVIPPRWDAIVDELSNLKLHRGGD
ncbi:MAG: hydantoinase/oxoprolinase family protein [Methermicoccaceae archaeon]